MEARRSRWHRQTERASSAAERDLDLLPDLAGDLGLGLRHIDLRALVGDLLGGHLADYVLGVPIV
ncbi:MAG: hypothetical protein U5O16_01335 [Rhodococcus sp. (in: high G+C Gram-positive bacteria)]|uniref:hypothetical protein n=1 Tax=Rhodococcus sp. TaxID=1831 RepID=UPI002AD9C857|nr:hypothetical protein [Rhodococcus sp. (in: high G+C Gram-positive bacteria)]